MAEELEAVEAPEAQQRTAVWRHPDRDTIHALIHKGKTAKWISRWLEEKYPVEDEWGTPHANAVENRSWQITPQTIDKYRREWLPESSPGVDIVHEGLEKVIGHHPNLNTEGKPYELDVLEAAIAVAQHNMHLALKADADMGMLQPVTLEAHDRMVSTARARAELAQKLSQPGYEEKAKQIHLQAETKNLNVEAEMNADGTLRPKVREPEKVRLMRQLLELGPEKARELAGIANETVRTTVVDAEEVTDGDADPAALSDDGGDGETPF